MFPRTNGTDSGGAARDEQSRRYLSLLRPHSARQRPGRVYGQGRGLRRQRGHGIGLRPAAKNVLDRQRWESRDQLRLAIITWIERTYYRRRRRQHRLGKLTPVEYEMLYTKAAIAA